MVKEVRRVIHTIRKWTESFDEALLSDKSIKDINKAEVKMAKEILDLKGVKCPYNYVKAKLKLEELNSGDEIEIYLDDGEPIANVPRSLADDGHTIISIDKLDDTHFKLLVKKGSS
jgi:TusA-related sulfurtransferase